MAEIPAPPVYQTPWIVGWSMKLNWLAGFQPVVQMQPKPWIQGPQAQVQQPNPGAGANNGWNSWGVSIRAHGGLGWCYVKCIGLRWNASDMWPDSPKFPEAFKRMAYCIYILIHLKFLDALSLILSRLESGVRPITVEEPMAPKSPNTVMPPMPAMPRTPDSCVPPEQTQLRRPRTEHLQYVCLGWDRIR